MVLYLKESFMNYLLLAPFYILVEVLLWFWCKKKHNNLSIGYLIGYQMLVCLMMMIFSVTGTAGIDDIGSYAGGIIRLEEINLVPFWMWNSFTTYGLVMNVLLFLPVGAMLPVLYPNARKFIYVTVTGAVLSLLIEVSQLFNLRATDIDDLMMNTLGAALGYCVYKLFLSKIRFFGYNGKKGRLFGCAILNVLIIFFMYFFLARPLRGQIYQLVYGW